ncbi:MAG: putative polymerase subfamily sigma factor [Ilumatobacteraceae bacterium]|nr:putative polymerase subfamily sigma factor [Ilumatobacteraceae bacterium]
MNGRVGAEPAGVGSFDLFYAAELPSLLALAAALLSNREAARDIVQETLLRVYREWSRVSRLDRPGGWARRVLINLATDVHRRRQREVRALTRLSSSELVFDEPDVDEFWRFVRDLPNRQRAAVALRYVEDLSVEAIAEVLEVSAGTVTKSLFMARQTLAARLMAEEARDDNS